MSPVSRVIARVAGPMGNRQPREEWPGAHISHMQTVAVIAICTTTLQHVPKL